MEFRRPHRVLIVSPYAAHPGHHWNNAEQIALALQKEGQRIAIFVHDKTVRLPAPEIAGSINYSPRWWQRIVRLLPADALRQPLETLGVLLAVSGASAKDRDSIVIHFIDATFLVFFVWDFLTRGRCVYNVMGSPEGLKRPAFLPNPLRWLKRGVTRWFLDRCLRRDLLQFCAETEAVGRDWAKVVGGRVTVIPYAINPVTKTIPQTRARAVLRLKQEETIFLLFGTQRADKDFATVIRAAKRLSPPPFLLFVGRHLSGPPPSTLLSELGFTNYQVIDRFVNQEEATLHFAACDAVLLPYNEGYEKGSGVLLEACQHLRPVIATDTGYLREFIEQHHTGWLFRSGDPDDLARCMGAVGNFTVEQRMGLSRSVAATASEYSWTRRIQDYFALYANLSNTATS